MKITADIEIEKPKEIIWSAITDIENCSNMISGIMELKILNQPEDGLVGLQRMFPFNRDGEILLTA